MGVAGCGGFIFGEKKIDMSKCFNNYVVWDDLDDLKDKVNFYLKNDTERNKIAEFMHNEAKLRHNNEQRMIEMLNLITW